MNIILEAILFIIVMIIVAELFFRMIFRASLYTVLKNGLYYTLVEPSDFQETPPMGNVWKTTGEINEPDNLDKDFTIMDKIKKIQEKRLPSVRIQHRKECEDKANAILTKNMGRLTKEHVEAFLDLIDRDYYNEGSKLRRFGSLFIGQNKRNILDNASEKNNLDKINNLIVEIYAKENLEDFRKLVSELKGIADGFVSSLLYLKDRDRYNVSIPMTRKGIKEIYPQTAIFHGSFKSKYSLFNKLANQLKTEYNLSPQEVDLVLWIFGDKKEMREILYS